MRYESKRDLENPNAIPDARKAFVRLLHKWQEAATSMTYVDFVQIDEFSEGLCHFIECGVKDDFAFGDGYRSLVHMVLDAHLREYGSTKSRNFSVNFPFSALYGTKNAHEERAAFVNNVLCERIVVTDEQITAECRRNGYV